MTPMALSANSAMARVVGMKTAELMFTPIGKATTNEFKAKSKRAVIAKTIFSFCKKHVIGCSFCCSLAFACCPLFVESPALAMNAASVTFATAITIPRNNTLSMTSEIPPD
mmetsp:Transcript_7874/g.12012  ORF Transcript_7874/g.12012 Transcript_7874/m.12012 type:complete len:111 (-) Transcript_7874:442-774(-)